MSSAEGLVAEAYQNWLSSAVQNAAAALVIYESLITFDDEVSLVWQKRWTVTSALLLASRWSLFVLTVAGLLSLLAPVTLVSCKGVRIVEQSFALFSYLQLALFGALRASALWNFNQAMFSSLFVLGSTPFITNMYGQTTSQWIMSLDPVTKMQVCYQVYSVSPQVDHMMLFITHVPIIVGEVLIIIFTWLKTYRQLREAKRLRMSLTLSTCLIRDGTVYFVASLILHVCRLLFSGIMAGTSPINALLQNLPQILSQRFLTNLRQLDAPTMSTDDTTVSSSSMLFYVSGERIGNIGEDLTFGTHDDIPSESAAPGDYDASVQTQELHRCTDSSVDIES